MFFFKKSKPFPDPRPSLLKEAFIFLGELLRVIVISLAIIIPVRYFLIQPFYVKGASMEPNFNDHEYLIIDEISYRFREPKRGEVVVFRYPLRPSEYFIKRIVGLPGEKITIENNQITVYNNSFSDGLTLQEQYLEENETYGTQAPTELASDEYYLLGDNRDESLDSRSFGPVKRKFITGRVWFIGWPMSKLGIYKAPVYAPVHAEN